MGFKMLLLFFCVIFIFMFGFVIVFIIFKNLMGVDLWKIFGVVFGLWIGGLLNMIVVVNVLGVVEEGFSYVIFMGFIGYIVWMFVCLMFVKFGFKFNKWIKCDISFIDEVILKFEKENKDNMVFMFVEFMILFFVGFGVVFFV